MELELITVSTRDGYRGAQEPVSFEWRGEGYRVQEILDRWYEGRMDSSRMPLRYFKVRTEEGRIFLLRYHELFLAWSLVVPAGEALGPGAD
jgi:hypothetical protein